jgi:hypothetical protein
MNTLNLKPDFCPQINLIMEMEFGEKRMSGLVLHNDILCVAKKLDKKSFLYKMFNSDNKEKTHLMKVHNVNINNTLESINFIAITNKEFKLKRNMYEKNKKKSKKKN